MPKSINKSIIIFDDSPVRRQWIEKDEKWYFSIVDIVKILTDQLDFQKARKYWNKLKERLNLEGSQSVTNCHQLKLLAKDGKKYLTDVADVETILRLIQSIPSKKAEPIKLWLARVGYERMQETIDPELSLNRSREMWQKHGRDQKWIQQRMMGQETRNKLTDYWSNHGVEEGKEYAILTNIIHQEWSGLSVKNHKNLKGIKQGNLRNHMSEAELIFTALAEMSTRKIAEKMKAEGIEENKRASKKGGNVSKKARHELEDQTGKPVVSEDNFLSGDDKKMIN